MRATHIEESVVRIPVARGDALDGNLALPDGAGGTVLFAHGSGSSRHSPRNRFVARELQGRGLATLLLDLLTAGEEQVDVHTREFRFDVGLLAERLINVTDWVREQRGTERLPIGYFGASTGAAAALIAAAERPRYASAVVSRGGRPDLAGEALARVEAPTLLIVGGWDAPVIELNREAYNRLHAAKRLEIVPRATHLFEEPGALEEVARLAADWFERYLPAREGPDGAREA